MDGGGRWILYLTHFHRKPKLGFVEEEDDDAEIPWVWNRNSFGRCDFLERLKLEEAEARWVSQGF